MPFSASEAREIQESVGALNGRLSAQNHESTFAVDPAAAMEWTEQLQSLEKRRSRLQANLDVGSLDLSGAQR